MQNLARQLDVDLSDSLAPHRHRAARAEVFPAQPDRDYEAREAAYVRSLLVDPLREIATTSVDPGARAAAETALASDVVTGDPVEDHARFEDALERIASATTDEGARTVAEDAVALYRGR